MKAPDSKLDIFGTTSECYQLGVAGELPTDLSPIEQERRRLIRGCERYALRKLRPLDGGIPDEAEDIESAIVVALLGAHELLGDALRYAASDALIEAARIMGAAKVAADMQSERIRVSSLDMPSDLKVEHISDVTDRVRQEHERGDTGYLTTPWPDLDQYLVGGYGPGELILLGARPGVGKTAIALEMARHVAAQGKRVLVVSREMVNSSLVRRVIAQTARIKAADLKLGNVPADVLEAGIKQVEGLPLWLCDKALNCEQIQMACDMVPEGVDFLVVDYLQLVYGPPGVKEMRLIVDRVAWQLKTIAQQREIPVLCLSALTRDADGQPPTMKHLRESGSLEHHASVVLFLHRGDPQDKTTVDLIVAKGREGYEGIIPLRFMGEYVSFLGPPTVGNGYDESEQDAEVVWG